MRHKTGFFARLVGPFCKNHKGSVATFAALALVPITIAAGFGLDLSRAMVGRGSLQDALDAAALALAHEPAGTSNAVLQAKGQAWLAANLANSGLGPISLTVTPGTGRLILDASSNVPTVISALAGITNVPVKAHTEINWGMSHVEVALVLDNTGSMNQNNKLSTLKTAANSLVDTLFTTAGTGDPNALKMSVVPFSMTVRLSSDPSQLDTYASANWMKGKLPYTAPYDADLFTGGANRFNLFDDIGKSWAGCVESRPAPYDVQDTPPTGSIKNTLFVPYFAPDEPDSGRVKKGSWGTYDFPHSYIDDDTNGNGFTDDNGANNWKVPQGQKSKYKKDTTWEDGPNEGCTGLQALLRLTGTQSAIKSKINAMTASGNTDVPMGMAWGWFTLSPNAPFSDGVAYNDAYTKKIMVVLTDGDNTNTDNDTPNHSTYSGRGYIWQKRLEGADETTSSSARSVAMDARMTLLCSNAKAAGITIYTVRVEVSGSASQALKGCASDPSMFYEVEDVSNLAAAFNAIAGSIGKLRISK